MTQPGNRITADTKEIHLRHRTTGKRVFHIPLCDIRRHNASSAVIRSACDGLWGQDCFLSVFGKCSNFVPGISSAGGCEAAAVEALHTLSSDIPCQVF